MRDLMNNIDVKRGISPLAQTNADTAFVSQILDTQNLKSATLVMLFGGITDADVTFALVAEESDAANMSGSNVIAAAQIIGTLALATPVFGSDDKCFKVGFLDTKRYIRVTLTPTGNNAGVINMGAAWVTEPNLVPTANPPA